jgi:hypothetical protein
MRYSIYILLAFIYTLMGSITFYIVRTMRRESRLEAQRKAAAAAVTPSESPTPTGSTR